MSSGVSLLCGLRRATVLALGHFFGACLTPEESPSCYLGVPLSVPHLMATRPQRYPLWKSFPITPRGEGPRLLSTVFPSEQEFRDRAPYFFPPERDTQAPFCFRGPIILPELEESLLPRSRSTSGFFRFRGGKTFLPRESQRGTALTKHSPQ